MKNKTLLFSILLVLQIFSQQIFAQKEDGQFIYDYLQSIAPVSMTDEGEMRADRQYKIDWIKDGYAMFYLPSSHSASAKCISGDCENGQGVVEYPSINARYEGRFTGGYPDSLGILTNKDGIRLFTRMEKGSMEGWQIFDLESRSFNQIGFKAEIGNLYTVRNMYWADYDMYYTGNVNGKLKPNKADGSFVERKNFKGRVGYLRDDYSVSTFIGELDYNDQYVFDGKLSSDFKFLSGKFIDKNNGTTIEPKFANDGSGKIYYGYVTIISGDSVYVGQTNQNFVPHGEGFFKVKGTSIEMNGDFVNGKFIDPYKEYEYTMALKKAIRNNKQKLIAKIDQEVGVTGYRGYLYKGSPSGWFTIKAGNLIESHVEIYVFNIGESEKEICLKPAIKGYRTNEGRKRACRTLEPILKVNDGKFEWSHNGYMKVGFSFPQLDENYSIYVEGIRQEDCYIIVKY